MDVVNLQRRDVVWVDFGEPRGSTPAYVRPAIVVSADRYNRSRLATVVVAAITSNTALARFEDNVFVAAGVAGLDRDSLVNVTQVFTIDRSLASNPVGTVPEHTMDQVDAGLATVLGLQRR